MKTVPFLALIVLTSLVAACGETADGGGVVDAQTGGDLVFPEAYSPGDGATTDDGAIGDTTGDAMAEALEDTFEYPSNYCALFAACVCEGCPDDPAAQQACASVGLKYRDPLKMDCEGVCLELLDIGQFKESCCPDAETSVKSCLDSMVYDYTECEDETSGTCLSVQYVVKTTSLDYTDWYPEVQSASGGTSVEGTVTVNGTPYQVEMLVADGLALGVHEFPAEGSTTVSISITHNEVVYSSDSPGSSGSFTIMEQPPDNGTALRGAIKGTLYEATGQKKLDLKLGSFRIE